MNEDSTAPGGRSRRRIAVIVGIALGLPAAALALLLALGGLVAFNGCLRSPGPVLDLISLGWLFIFWPAAAVGAAVVPAVQIARGRTWLRAGLALAGSAVLAFGVYLLGIALMYAVHC